MFKKSFIVIALIVSLMAIFMTDSSFGWPGVLLRGGLGVESPYDATWEVRGSLDGPHEGYLDIQVGAIEWINPNDKSVIDGLAGGQFIITSTEASIEVDESGKITLHTYFPYLVEHCDLVSDCADLIPKYGSDPYAREKAFLEFFDVVDENGDPIWYKANWVPTRLIILETELWAKEYKFLNNKTLEAESPLAYCLTTETYRTFNPPLTYICNETDDPFAIDDHYIMKKDVFSGNVLNNDFDIEENYPLGEAEIVKSASSGELVLNADGSFTYTKGDNFTDEDFFDYQVKDSKGNVSNIARVTLRAFK